MAIYTCYDMIRDCRQDKPHAWRFLVINYVPALSRIAAHYRGGEAAVDSLLQKLRGPGSPLAQMNEMSGREFVHQLRPHLLPPPSPSPLDAEAVLEALSPLTATERQQAWFETFGYTPEDAARIMRMAPGTGRKIYERSAELLRSKLDDWQAGMLAKHGRALGEAVLNMRPAETLSYRDFFDVIDGRNTWQHRTTFARTLESSWYEVHRACEIREADEALEKSKPLTEAEARPWLDRLGIPPPKQGILARLLGSKS